MNNLLKFALDAHGGLDRWTKISHLTAQASIGGALWPAKGKPGMLDEVEVRVDTRRQQVEISPFGGEGRRSIYQPDRVAIVNARGEILQSRENPRAAFAGHVRETPWDDLHVAYFSGYANWTYLTTPFLFTLPGFTCEEIAPWQEQDETWRRLRVIFPKQLISHSTEQIFYFGEDGILRRHDYQPHVLGGVPSANYATDPQNFGGLTIPAKRRVFTRGEDNRPLPGSMPVTIDFGEIKVFEKT